jgi:hypothetical protein
MSFLGKVRRNLNRDVAEVLLPDEAQQARLEAQRAAFLDQLAMLASKSRVSYDAVHLAAVILLAGEGRANAARAVADRLGGVVSGVNPQAGLDHVLSQVEHLVAREGAVWKDYQGKLPFQPPEGYQADDDDTPVIPVYRA